MARQPLELKITRKGRNEATLNMEADPGNPAEVRDILRNWLEGEGWARGRWGEFEMSAFAERSWKRLLTVRP